MPHPRRFLAALALACPGAFAQTTTTATTTTTVPASAITVQRIAPQLVAFAGSQANFQNLVTGLAQGTPVQLVSVLPDGSAQVVSFTPTGQLTTEQIAQSLEAARQRLIGLGIAAPTAEQLATVPHITPAIASAIAAKKPYKTAGEFNAVLAASLSKQQLAEVYPKLFVPINLNTASSADIMLIPGMSRRMVHEFEEYRPYTSLAQFDKEIGKYVSPAEVARLRSYVSLN